MHANMLLVSRDAFSYLGGFPKGLASDGGEGEFLAEAVFRGYHLQVVPLPLFWYRRLNESEVPDPHINPTTRRAMQPYAKVCRHMGNNTQQG